MGVSGPHVANHNQPLYGGLTMTTPDIQKSQHLLKHLKDEMSFLSSLMAQLSSLMRQADFVASGLQWTWKSLERAQESEETDIEKP